MSERTFVGVCIGGPKAGEMIAQRDRQFQVHEWPKQPLGRPDDPIADVKGKVTAYIHHHTGGPLNLWLYDGMDLVEALRLMAEAYIEKAQAQHVEDDDIPPGVDLAFANAWLNMERLHGYQYSDDNIRKVHLGWQMHRRMKQENTGG